MKVYRWLEADDRMIAVVRPDALFDTQGLDAVLAGLADLDGAEVVVKLRHRARGEDATYAIAFERGLPAERVARQVKQMRNVFEASDAAG